MNMDLLLHTLRNLIKKYTGFFRFIQFIISADFFLSDNRSMKVEKISISAESTEGVIEGVLQDKRRGDVQWSEHHDNIEHHDGENFIIIFIFFSCIIIEGCS